MHISNLLVNMLGVLKMLPYMLVGLSAMMTFHWLLSWWEGCRSSDVAHAGNTALAIRHASAFIAIGIGMSGVFVGNDKAFFADLEVSMYYSFGLVVFMAIALWVNDVLILPQVDNTVAVKANNNGVAVVEFGSAMATGCIARGAVMGEYGGAATSIVFFLLGQAAMVLAVMLYNRINRDEYSLAAQACEGNLAAGLILGGKIWAYGLILSAAVAGNFVGWYHDISMFVFLAMMGLLYLILAEWAVHKLVVNWTNVKEIVAHNNVPAALMLAGAKVGMAYVIFSVVL